MTNLVSRKNFHLFAAIFIIPAAALLLLSCPGPAPSKKSSNARLKNITVSAGSLSPTFNAETASYTVSVGNNVTSITVIGTQEHSGANVSYVPSQTVDLAAGTPKIITIHVTAENGDASQNYSVTVTRAVKVQQGGDENPGDDDDGEDGEDDDKEDEGDEGDGDKKDGEEDGDDKGDGDDEDPEDPDPKPETKPTLTVDGNTATIDVVGNTINVSATVADGSSAAPDIILADGTAANQISGKDVVLTVDVAAGTKINYAAIKKIEEKFWDYSPASIDLNTVSGTHPVLALPPGNNTKIADLASSADSTNTDVKIINDIHAKYNANSPYGGSYLAVDSQMELTGRGVTSDLLKIHAPLNSGNVIADSNLQFFNDDMEISHTDLIKLYTQCGFNLSTNSNNFFPTTGAVSTGSGNWMGLIVTNSGNENSFNIYKLYERYLKEVTGDKRSNINKLQASAYNVNSQSPDFLLKGTKSGDLFNSDNTPREAGFGGSPYAVDGAVLSYMITQGGFKNFENIYITTTAPISLDSNTTLTVKNFATKAQITGTNLEFQISGGNYFEYAPSNIDGNFGAAKYNHANLTSISTIGYLDLRNLTATEAFYLSGFSREVAFLSPYAIKHGVGSHLTKPYGVAYAIDNNESTSQFKTKLVGSTGAGFNYYSIEQDIRGKLDLNDWVTAVPQLKDFNDLTIISTEKRWLASNFNNMLDTNLPTPLSPIVSLPSELQQNSPQLQRIILAALEERKRNLIQRG